MNPATNPQTYGMATSCEVVGVPAELTPCAPQCAKTYGNRGGDRVYLHDEPQRTPILAPRSQVRRGPARTRAVAAGHGRGVAAGEPEARLQGAAARTHGVRRRKTQAGTGLGR